MEQQLVVFELANEQYGLDISTVEGIIKMQAITKMPQAPVFVERVDEPARTVGAGHRSYESVSGR